MNNKFKYSPGLPGYGTVGADGSAGLLGLSMYFSSFDGILDTNTLASRIDNDELLYGVSGIKIPGWPERTYRDGEIFMDINGAVFSINKSLTNRYEDTTSKLNTSGFFKVGPQQNVDPGFQRYSNNFDNATNIIDTVYTNAVGDYTAFPANIYDDGALYYARINYVGSDVVTDLTSDFYPFDVWTIGSGDANAIALTREKDSNAWHLGNKDGGSQRDVSLYLDFTKVGISGNLDINRDLRIVGSSFKIINAQFRSSISGGNPKFIFDTNVYSGASYQGGAFMIIRDSAIDYFRIGPTGINLKEFPSGYDTAILRSTNLKINKTIVPTSTNHREIIMDNVPPGYVPVRLDGTLSIAGTNRFGFIQSIRRDISTGGTGSITLLNDGFSFSSSLEWNASGMWEIRYLPEGTSQRLTVTGDLYMTWEYSP